MLIFSAHQVLPSSVFECTAFPWIDLTFIHTLYFSFNFILFSMVSIHSEVSEWHRCTRREHSLWSMLNFKRQSQLTMRMHYAFVSLLSVRLSDSSLWLKIFSLNTVLVPAHVTSSSDFLMSCSILPKGVLCKTSGPVEGK